MHIDLTRSGGFGGITRRASLGPGDLTSEEERRIEQALEKGEVGKPERKTSGKNVDRFQYDLTVTVDDQRHSLSASETELPPDVRRLLDELINRQQL